jgi:hypothetical protein
MQTVYEPSQTPFSSGSGRQVAPGSSSAGKLGLWLGLGVAAAGLVAGAVVLIVFLMKAKKTVSSSGVDASEEVLESSATESEL